MRRHEAFRLAQAHAVDDRGVVEGVRQEAVLLAEERREEPLVRVPARHVEDGVLGAEELRDRRLEVLVERLRPADEAHGAEAVAPRVKSLRRSLDDAWMVREAEVVVRREHEDFAPVHAHARARGSLEDALLLPGLRLFQGGDLFAAELGQADAHAGKTTPKCERRAGGPAARKQVEIVLPG